MSALRQDLRYAVRGLAKARGFAAVAILTLAFALGASSAIFSVVNAILLQPLPYHDGERLVRVTTGSLSQGTSGFEWSWLNYGDVRDWSQTLTGLAIYNRSSSFFYEGAEPERRFGASVSREMFDVLQVHPLLGRPFNEADDHEGAGSVLAISSRLWKERFGGDPHVIGKAVRFGSSGKSRTIVAVLPPEADYPPSENATDFWIPIYPGLGPNARTNRDLVYMNVLGRMKPGVTIEKVQAEMTVLAKRLATADPVNRDLALEAKTLHETMVGNVKPALLILLGAVAVVLLIGCANVANLLLARAAARQREIAIRTAMGATRARIVTQLLVESVLLSLLAGVCGLLLAAWGIDALVALAPSDIPRLDQIALDGRVLAFTFLLSVLTGILFGLAPALAASKSNLVETLKEGSRGSTEGRKRNRVRSALIVAEISLSIVLLAGTGLLLRSFMRLSNIDAGYASGDRMTMALSARASAYDTDEKIAQFYQRLLETVTQIPGVESAAAASDIPLSGGENAFNFHIEGTPLAAPGSAPGAVTVVATPGYFQTMGIPILKGRAFTRDDRAGAPPVMIVSHAFAGRYLHDREPIGTRIMVLGTTWEVAGIAGDVRYWQLGQAPKPLFYFPHGQQPLGSMVVVVHAQNASSIGNALRGAVKSLDPEQPILDMDSLQHIRASSISTRRFSVALLGLLAALALSLAAVGIYSVMSYSVAQRTSEIGIRMALGADAHDVFHLIVGQAVRLVAIGGVVGVVVALLATRVLRSLLYEVTPSDPLTFAAIVLLISGTALVASYVPARRAAKVDPLQAIRYD